MTSFKVFIVNANKKGEELNTHYIPIIIAIATYKPMTIANAKRQKSTRPRFKNRDV